MGRGKRARVSRGHGGAAGTAVGDGTPGGGGCGAAGAASLLALPDELVLRVLGFLGAEDLSAVDATCRRFRARGSWREPLSLTELGARRSAAALAARPLSLAPGEHWKTLLRFLARPIRILPSGLHRDDIALLTKVQADIAATWPALDVEVVADWSPDVTHIVTAAPERKAEKRTLKVLHGIVHGAWVLSFEWVEASCIKGRWLLDELFEVELHSPPVLQGYGLASESGALAGPRLGRRRAWRAARAGPSSGTVPRLLEGKRFLLAGTFEAPRVPREDLVALIEGCGGKLLDRDGFAWRAGLCSPPRRGHENVTILASHTITAQEVIALAKEWGRQPITVSWLLDSVSAYRLCPHQPYELPPMHTQAWDIERRPPPKLHRHERLLPRPANSV